MKNTILLICLCLISLFSLGGNQNRWFEISLPNNLSDFSYLNIGKSILDAPAGKYGFLKINHDSFGFKDQTPVKFWGTNLCFEACFPAKDQADEFARRISFYGYNAVRLHHMDYSFEPEGIFKNDKEHNNTQSFSDTQMDKLDYFIYQLKRYGVYVDLNLLVSRHFTKEDGFQNNGFSQYNHVPISLFDRTLINLQKKYAKNLLTHYNPYTKLTYNTDPAIAFVEVTNENSLFFSWIHEKLNRNQFGEKKYIIPDYYIRQLDLLWSKWLKKHYKHNKESLNSYLKNTKKEIFHKEDNWELQCLQDTKAAVKYDANKVTIEIQQSDSTNWHIQYKLKDIEFEKDNIYIFSFRASAEESIPIAITLQQQQKPWKVNGLSQSIVLSTEMRYYKIPFVYGGIDELSSIAFHLGGNKTVINLENIELLRINYLSLKREGDLLQRPMYRNLKLFSPNIQSNIEEFYLELQKEYVNEMIGFLKNECQIKVPITGIGGVLRKKDINSLKKSDFIDFHAYWDHPSFPGKAWDRNNFKIKNISGLENNKIKIIQKIRSFDSYATRYFNKPFTITEWDHCFPNKYAHETPMAIAANAVNDGWDAIFSFNFSNGFRKKSNYVDNYFLSNNNPQKQILCSFASLLYLNERRVIFELENNIYNIQSDRLQCFGGLIKNRSLSFGKIDITSNINGVILVYSLDEEELNRSKKNLLLIMGEIANTGSYWNSKNKFIWGKDPVLHEPYKIKISINTKKVIKLFALNYNFEKKQELKPDLNTNNFILNSDDTQTIWYEVQIN